MRITSLMAAYAPEVTRPTQAGREGALRASTKNGDSIEISPEGRRRLEMVRKRIDSGYYSSEAVAENVSDKLSEILDDIVK